MTFDWVNLLVTALLVTALKSSRTILATSDREASFQGFTLFQSWRYKTQIVIERHKTP